MLHEQTRQQFPYPVRGNCGTWAQLLQLENFPIHYHHNIRIRTVARYYLVSRPPFTLPQLSGQTDRLNIYICICTYIVYIWITNWINRFDLNDFTSVFSFFSYFLLNQFQPLSDQHRRPCWFPHKWFNLLKHKWPQIFYNYPPVM